MRGRRPGSPVRVRIAGILGRTGPLHGYQIYKLYKEIFGDVCMRTVYYNLRSGERKKEFVIAGVKKEKGDYTWGPEAEKIYYDVGPNATTHKLSDVEERRLKSLTKT